MATLLTVREIAQQIRRPDERLETVVDRLRNWTKEGLLQPSGERNPGTGAKRTYPEETIVDAQVLRALNDWGVPAVRAAKYGTPECNAIIEGRTAAKEAKERYPQPVYLLIAQVGREAHVSPEHVSVQYGDQISLPPHTVSALILNVTSMLLQPAAAGLTLTSSRPIVTITTNNSEKSGE